MPFKIAIIGAGPVGCALGRLLSQSDHQIDITIFEGESGIDFRSQGGSLDLHEKTGQAALKAAGLFDEFLKHARYDGEAIKIADKKMLCYVKQGASKKGSTTGRPEIDRPKLRELLFNSLPPNTVQWSKKLLRVDEILTLHFADGTTSSGFNLIVGADGAWSKTRALLSNEQPYYSGIGGHALNIPSAEKNAPKLYDLCNRGSLFAFSDGKSIMSQQMGDGSINMSTWAVRPAHWQQESGYDTQDLEATKIALRKEYADWDPRLVDFTQKAQGSAIPRDLFMLPVGFKWKHVPGVTIIGDAAHVMTPFAGEGVNLGLEDALSLSRAVISAAASTIESIPEEQHAELDKKVLEFEQDMFKRATKTQQLTCDMMSAMFNTPGAPRHGIERYILRAIGDEMGPWTTSLLLTPIIYAWFFVFKMIY